jgi:hypothetical protein
MKGRRMNIYVASTYCERVRLAGADLSVAFASSEGAQ